MRQITARDESMWFCDAPVRLWTDGRWYQWMAGLVQPNGRRRDGGKEKEVLLIVCR